MERIKKVLDDLDVKYGWHPTENGKWYGIVEFWTDTADQDIPTEIEFDGTAEDFVKEFCEAAENYNVDEEVELFVDMRGKNGVPDTVRGILDDCEEAKKTLIRIATILKNALKPKEFTIEFCTTYVIEAGSQEEAIEKAYKEFEIDLESYGTDLFYRYDENGKGI